MSEVSISPSHNNDRSSNLSLLSLSIVAASAAPIAVAPSADSTVRPSQASHNNAGTKHRRLSSTGKTRRRLSDARDAAIRPSPASVQTPATALSSLANLSLSSPPTKNSQVSTSLTANSQAMDSLQSFISIPAPRANVNEDTTSQAKALENETSISPPAGIPISGLTKGGKKRGSTFTCESCSKVYRHPSCLIKHRWEHTPQWREASKFVLSKHQQVQLLEAAAILSHLSPSSASLPDDRSLWPFFLSGGQLPAPANGSEPRSLEATAVSPGSVGPGYPISSSVPATSNLHSDRATSTGPRLHDYSVPQAVPGSGGITQLRPGLLGVPTAPSPANDITQPVSASRPVPVPSASNTADAHNLLAFRSQSVHSESWGSPISSAHYDTASFSLSSAHSHRGESLSHSYAPSDVGWSLPRSSVRSVSASSRSRSASESKSDDEDNGEFADVDVNDSAAQNLHVYGYSSRGRISSARFGWKTEDEDPGLGFSVREEDEDEAKTMHTVAKGQEEWDGMEMDMEMD
ncbi:hypothetical protein BJ138DRAFT_1117016 [Hygrophoropsis aurantiaca]|uniref:Uncharacterized protein n=1 Tax=Hygrophoropsis aurantiaca TaxID=72124 RepID=A0ACB8A0V1_9AGAM|nr:hypothetical protein BJ138DRAFT_1117016 [Hygrophoropsis aurantiaca]